MKRNITAEAGTAPEVASTMEEVFGPVIYSYTRAQALADGFQVDISSTAKEAGIRFPVFITRAAWAKCVEVPKTVQHQDEAGRLWDVVWMLRHGITKAPAGSARITFALYVNNGQPKGAQLMTLRSTCGPLDQDKPEPAITISLPDED